jgi:hypothetical protein
MIPRSAVGSSPRTGRSPQHHGGGSLKNVGLSSSRHCTLTQIGTDIIGAKELRPMEAPTSEVGYSSAKPRGGGEVENKKEKKNWKKKKKKQLKEKMEMDEKEKKKLKKKKIEEEKEKKKKNKNHKKEGK